MCRCILGGCEHNIWSCVWQRITRLLHLPVCLTSHPFNFTCTVKNSWCVRNECCISIWTDTFPRGCGVWPKRRMWLNSNGTGPTDQIQTNTKNWWWPRPPVPNSALATCSCNTYMWHGWAFHHQFFGALKRRAHSGKRTPLHRLLDPLLVVIDIFCIVSPILDLWMRTMTLRELTTYQVYRRRCSWTIPILLHVHESRLRYTSQWYVHILRKPRATFHVHVLVLNPNS